jgi:branched-chain amino acid transport system ATP-binding protein
VSVGTKRAGDSTILEVDQVHCHFGGVRAVDGASFSVARATITALIGPNGAGKTTMLNLIAGVEVPSSGEIRYEGLNIAGEPPHRVAQRGLIRTFQKSSEWSRLTVLENLVAAAPRQRGGSFSGALRSRRYWRDSELLLVERARELLERFDMSHKQDEYAGELSGGQKRLVEIMRALMAEPTVLLLDEPFAGLLPTLARTIEGHLMALRDEGLTMLMVEHELGPVERMADSTIVMAQGQVLARGLMTELRDNSAVVEAYLVG